MPNSRENFEDIRHSQNYIKSDRLAEHLLDWSSIGPQDLVIEIGPGKGKITRCLAARCRQVIAVEKDERLVQPLIKKLENVRNVAIYHADFLSMPLPRSHYKVFANIPFDITTAIVARLTKYDNPPDDCYLVMQRQAAERFSGTPRESLYALLLKQWFEPTIIHRFRREDFDPAPRVDVVMLRLRKRGPPLISTYEAQRFRDFVVHSFIRSRPDRGGIRIGSFTAEQSRRLLSASGVDPYSKPTEIQFEQWLEMFNRFVCEASIVAWQDVIGSESRLIWQQAKVQKRHRSPSAATGTDHHRR